MRVRVLVFVGVLILILILVFVKIIGSSINNSASIHIDVNIMMGIRSNICNCMSITLEFGIGNSTRRMVFCR